MKYVMGLARIGGSVQRGYELTQKVIRYKEANGYVDIVRDIYNREDSLARWLTRIKEIPEPDKSDLLTFFDLMHNGINGKKGKAIKTMITHIQRLLQIRTEVLDKPFRDATKADIQKVITWTERLEEKEVNGNKFVKKKYKSSSQEKFREA